jgi:hypothetical protein
MVNTTRDDFSNVLAGKLMYCRMRERERMREEALKME